MVAMKTLRRSVVTWAGFAAIALLVSACASASNPLTNPTEFDTLVPGWESKFTLDWKAEPARDGSMVLYGRVSSQYGQFASPFRVLGMAVDSSGKVIGQRIEWVPGGVPGFNQAYFQIDHLVAAASYRVTVWDYSFVEMRGTMP
jgi:hypothetical protein